MTILSTIGYLAAPAGGAKGSSNPFIIAAGLIFMLAVMILILRRRR